MRKNKPVMMMLFFAVEPMVNVYLYTVQKYDCSVYQRLNVYVICWERMNKSNKKITMQEVLVILSQPKRSVENNCSLFRVSERSMHNLLTTSTSTGTNTNT